MDTQMSAAKIKSRSMVLVTDVFTISALILVGFHKMAWMENLLTFYIGVLSIASTVTTLLYLVDKITDEEMVKKRTKY